MAYTLSYSFGLRQEAQITNRSGVNEDLGISESLYAWGRKDAKIQLLTISQLLAGKQINMPPMKRTFKERGRELVRKEEQGKLF
jgi:hypothetical protein